MAAITSTMPETEDALVSVEEYIDRFVDGGEKPTCEYVDGELFPKSMGTKKHSKTQQNIQYYIRQKYGQAFDPLPELTTRLRKKKFYVPDVAIEDRAHPSRAAIQAPKTLSFSVLRSCHRLTASVRYSVSAKSITSGGSATAG